MGVSKSHHVQKRLDFSQEQLSKQRFNAKVKNKISLIMAANIKDIKRKLLESEKVIPIETLKEIEDVFKKIEKGINSEEYEILLDKAINNNYPELAQYLKDLAALKLIEHLGSWKTEENSHTIQTDWYDHNVEAIGENPDHPITIDY